MEEELAGNNSYTPALFQVSVRNYVLSYCCFNFECSTEVQDRWKSLVLCLVIVIFYRYDHKTSFTVWSLMAIMQSVLGHTNNAANK